VIPTPPSVQRQLVLTDHPRITRFSSSGDAVKVSHLAKADLEPFVDELSPNDLKRNLKILIPEYEPCFD
jgi:hypothetical protein